MAKKLLIPHPEAKQNYSVIVHKGQRIIKIIFKPQFAIMDDNGKIEFVSNDLKSAKQHIQKRRNI